MFVTVKRITIGIYVISIIPLNESLAFDTEAFIYCLKSQCHPRKQNTANSPISGNNPKTGAGWLQLV